MRSRHLFLASLTTFVLLYLGYGLQRFSLGIDLTDEGGHVAWPLRMLFGEKPFTAEMLTLRVPIEAYLYLPFKLHPSMTLYEFRLTGWCLHLLSFGVLSSYLFRLRDAPLQAPLIASIPFFVCNIFGLTSPYYNTLSSDFLLLALSLRGLSSLTGSAGNIPMEIGAGCALFVATLAHPPLGLVAACILAYELFGFGLARNLVRGRLTASNVGVLAFLTCWMLFGGYLAGSGALADWWHGIDPSHSLTPRSLQNNPVLIFLQLLVYPFVHSRVAVTGSIAALSAAAALHILLRAQRVEAAGRIAALLVFLLIAVFIGTFSFEPDYLPVCLAFASLVLIGTLGTGITAAILPADPRVRLHLLLSGLGGVLYATFSYYFSPLRSWTSGTLGLPFAFAAGLMLLLKLERARMELLRILVTAALVLAVACAAREHYRSIYRDDVLAELRATSHIPKLRHIHSTEERMQALDELYDYLHPRIARGEALLVYDDCPMLYFLLDAMPAYGQAWAVRFGQSPEGLRQLDRELKAKPLPRYAIRTLVDVSYPVWSAAPRTNYDHYPLNETVMNHYELERTIFPFEIWRVKPTAPREKTSPDLPGR